LTFWWDSVPDKVKSAVRVPDEVSNIRLIDYAGAESCKKCHRENHDAWSNHSHRFMNAMANEQTVKGDFPAALRQNTWVAGQLSTAKTGSTA